MEAIKEKKFTPGPWKIDENAQITDGNYILGRVYCGDVFPCEDEELNANAKLIAAAPELLEALLSILETNETFGNLLNYDINIARQAIQKATS